MKQTLVAGVDFGSDSVRVVLLDVNTGKNVADAVSLYPRWQKKLFCDPARNLFRQHPLDYIESLEDCMQSVMRRVGPAGKSALRAIAIDTTGSTPCPVNRDGTPLALLEDFKDNPNAMFNLWKDHTAVEEAKEINQVFSDARIDYTMYQGTYSSEWYWAKILHTIRIDPGIRQEAWTWVEHCDWMPSLLTGKTDPSDIYRGACAAGHKALWHSTFFGLPDVQCLSKLDPYLARIAERYNTEPLPAGTNLGVISKEWSARLGVPEDIIVGGGSFDAHAGAVGAGIRPRTLVKVVGTSTVDMLIEDTANLTGKNLRDYCGQAENSIVPGYVGIEAGQAAFGDVYAWFASVLMWPLRELFADSAVINEEQRAQLTQEADKKMIAELERKAQTIDENDLTAVDWFNGRRYPYLNENVKGAVMGLTLGSSAPAMYRALVQSTVFGSKRIFDSFIANKLQIDQLILVGGIANKSPFTMQMMADVLNRPVMVCRSEQICARGAAIFAAVASGLMPDVPTAQNVFSEPYRASYFPIESHFQKYEQLYRQYLLCGNFMEEFTNSTART